MNNASSVNNAIDLLSRRVVKLVQRTTQLQRRVSGHDEKIALVQGQETILQQRIGSNESVISNLANDVTHSVQLTSSMMMAQQNMDGLIAQVEQRVMGVNDMVRNLQSSVLLIKENKNNHTNVKTDNDTNRSQHNQSRYMNQICDNNVDDALQSTKANDDAIYHQDQNSNIHSELDGNKINSYFNEQLSENQRKSVIALVQVMLAQQLRKLNLTKQPKQQKNDDANVKTNYKNDQLSIQAINDGDNIRTTQHSSPKEVNKHSSNQFVDQLENQSLSSCVRYSNKQSEAKMPTLNMFATLQNSIVNLANRLQSLETRLNHMVMQKLIVDRVMQYTLPDTGTAPSLQHQPCLTQTKYEQSVRSAHVRDGTDNTAYTSSIDSTSDNGIAENNEKGQNTISSSSSSLSSKSISQSDKVQTAIHSRLHIDDQWFEQSQYQRKQQDVQQKQEGQRQSTNNQMRYNLIAQPLNSNQRYNDYRQKLRVLLRDAGAFPFKDANGSTQIVSEKLVLRHVPVNWGAAEVRNLCVRCCQAHNKNSNTKNSVSSMKERMNDDPIGIVSCIVRRALLPRPCTFHSSNTAIVSTNDNTSNTITKNNVSNEDVDQFHQVKNNSLSYDSGNRDICGSRLRHAGPTYRSLSVDAKDVKSIKLNNKKMETASSSSLSAQPSNYYANTFANTDLAQGGDQKYERAFEITFISAQHALNALLALNRCTLNDKHVQHQQKNARNRLHTSSMPQLQKTTSGLRILAEPVISADILQVLRHLQERE